MGKKEKLAEGILKTLRNAQELCDESELLCENKMYARSYSLSHLAREELAKCFILYRPLVDFIIGEKIDWKKIRRRFRSHKAKIIGDRATTHHLFGEELAKKGVDNRTLFSGIEKTNEFKNSSIYVDWLNDDFIMPSECINKNKAERNLQIAIFRIKMFTPIFVEITKLSPEVEEKMKITFANNDIDKIIEEKYKDIFTGGENTNHNKT